MRADGGPCDEIFKDGWTFGAGGCPRGPELQREIRYFMQKVTELEAAMALPHVDKRGGSECPFAEDLYAEKERLEREVLTGVTRLSGYLLTLEKWIENCRENIERIEGDGQKLHGAEAQGCYSDAVNHLQTEYRRAVQDKDAVSIAVKKAKAVLQVSSTRKFPGREPQKRTFAPVVPPRRPAAAHSYDPNGGMGGEIHSLLSMGPISAPRDGHGAKEF